MKNIIVKKITAILLLVCALFVLTGASVLAEDEPSDLPVITQWDQGKGYDASGSMLKDTWALDSVNVDGKYVLFGADGEVLQKADKWQERNETEENYSITDQSTGIIAVRCSTFQDFTGIVEGVLEEEAGTRYSFELDQENGYSRNVSVSAGSYRLLLTAYDDKFYYQTNFQEEAVEIQGEGFEIVNLQVTQETTGTVSVQAENERKNNVLSNEVQSQRVSEDELEKMGAFLLITVLICIAGYGIYRKRKKTYT